MIVVTTLDPGAPGLTGDYLRYAEHGLDPVQADDHTTGWPHDLADELRRTGATVRSAYPVGPWRLELCVGDDADTRFLECLVDPHGPEAHIDRHLTLMRLGWTVVDAYASRWDGDVTRAAIELANRD